MKSEEKKKKTICETAELLGSLAPYVGCKLGLTCAKPCKIKKKKQQVFW